MEAVRRTLEAVAAPTLNMYNKCDLIDGHEQERLERQTEALSFRGGRSSSMVLAQALARRPSRVPRAQSL